MKAKHARRKLFVDPEVQGALVTRCVIYWCVSLIVVFAALLSPDFIFVTLGLVSPTGPSIWVRYAPALILSAALTPVLVLDLLRCTNRFAGPMVRTRRFLRSLANGERIEPIEFRNDDFWKGYAGDLNAVLQRIETLERQAAAAGEPADMRASAAEVARAGTDADLVYSH